MTANTQESAPGVLLTDPEMGPPDAPRTLALWLVDLKGEPSLGSRLLYGWVIPSTPPRAGKWLEKSDEGDSRLLSKSQIRVTPRLLILKLELRDAVHLVHLLYNGKSLGDACAALGLPVPPDSAAAFSLGTSKEDILGRYEVIPPHIQPASQALTLSASWLQGLSSPMAHAPARCMSVFLVDKSSVIWGQDGKTRSDAEQLLREMLEYLSRETGLGFTSLESGRLGNLDFFAFPSAGAFDEPRVLYRLRRDAACVELDLASSAPSSEFLVRCRIIVGEVIAADTCRQVSGGAPSSLVFPAPASANFVLVTVWKREAPEEDWRFWHEDGSAYIESVSVRGTLGSMEVSLQSDWLDRYLDSRVSARARQMQVVSPTRDSVPVEVSIGAAWLKADRTMRDVARRLFPQRSTGGFFPNGWGDEGPGLLSFFEWFQTRVSSAEQGSLVLVDPYFGSRGLELLIRASQPHVALTVLTHSQLKSKDEPDELPGTETREPSRAIELRRVCERLEVLLRRTRLLIKDLRRKGGRQAELFHDRYLLLFDASNQPHSGFNLSNSIQGATRHSPLLVTPIPEDLLPAVGDYVQALLEARAPVVNDAECITLFDSSKLPHRSEPTRFTQVAVAPFFASILEHSTLLSSSEDALIDSLSAIGLVSGRPPDHTFDTPDFILEKLPRFSSVLENRALGDEEFALAWGAFTAWLRRTPDAHRALRALMRDSHECLLERLQSFLLGAPRRPHPVGAQGVRLDERLLGIPGVLRGDFEWLIDNLQHLHIPQVTHESHGIFYAATALAHHAPQLAARTLERMAKQFPPHGVSNDLDGSSAALFSTIGALLSALFESLLPTGRAPAELFQSDVSVVRALAVELTGIGLASRSLDLTEALQQIALLPTDEQRAVLARWIVEASHPHRGATWQFPSVRAELITVLQQLWDASVEHAEVERLIRRIGGTALGATAEALDSELLLPLEQQNKITSDTCLRLWNGILLSQLGLSLELSGTKTTRTSYLRPDGIQGLARACATAFARASPKAQNELIQSWDRIVVKTSRLVNAPFSRSRDWYGWSNAAVTTLRIRVLAGQTLVHCLKVHPGATPPQQLVRLYEKTKLELPDHALEGIEGLDALRAFLTEVQREIETLGHSR